MIMKKIFTSAAVVLVSAIAIKAQTPTWAENVAPILYGNCTSCHHVGGAGPFSLMTYDDAYNNKDLTLVNVVQRTMPPWPPDFTYRQFAHQRVLTQDQINTIQNWVMGGAPMGNPANAPTPPVYLTNSEISAPDYSHTMQSFTVNADYDLYRCFVLPANSSVDKFITELEVQPGNTEIVHHVLVYQDQSNTCITLDNNDPGPGYTSFGGIGSGSAKLIGAWVPGQSAMKLPPNMGIKLPANANIILQIHYPGGTYNKTDSTKLNLKFSTSSSLREVNIDPMLHHMNGGNGGLTNGPLVIPANQVKTFNAVYNLPAVNVSILNVGPHMHLIGKSIKVWAVSPVNDTIPLIRIKNWDFHWQGFYSFKNVLKIPASSKVYAEATYDNTSANPHNPSSPPQTVTLGEATTSEMMLVYFSYLLYLPGDENIVIDDNYLSVDEEEASGIVNSIQLYDVYPNPASDQISIGFFIPKAGKVKTEIIDLNGRSVMNFGEVNQGAGFTVTTKSISHLPSGTYFLKVTNSGTERVKKIVKI